MSAPPSMRIQAASQAADLVARTDPGHAADLLELAVRLLPEVAPRQLERSDQQHALGGYAGLAAHSAALALAAPAPPLGDRAGRAVVGTLWAIADKAATEIADAFYENLVDPAHGVVDPERAPHALHRAVRTARAARPGFPSFWAAHLHSGA